MTLPTKEKGVFSVKGKFFLVASVELGWLYTQNIVGEFLDFGIGTNQQLKRNMCQNRGVRGH